MDNLDKKGYSEALLACSVPKRMILACPLAFGEVGVKERVRSVKNYKKPTFWIIVVGVAVCIALVVGFLTNPKEDLEEDKISMVMYNDIVYAETEPLERTYAYIYKGEIESSTKRDTPTKNFQANDKIVGCGIYEAINLEHYIFILQEGTYIPYKNVNMKDMYIPKSKYDTYYGGIVEKEEGNIALLTEVSDELTAYFDGWLNNVIGYEKCSISLEELLAISEYISAYRADYISSDDEALNELMKAVVDNGYNIENNNVRITMVNCTEDKIALFKEKVLDSEQLVFENYSVDQYNWPTEPEKEVDWGLVLSVKDVTSTGLTMVFTHSGDNTNEELFINQAYHLCVFENGVWRNVEYAGMIEEWLHGDYKIAIPINDTLERSYDWKFEYGTLPTGNYKIGIKISRRTVGNDTYEDVYFFAEFIVEEEELSFQPVSIPSLDEVNEETIESIKQNLLGLSKEQVRYGWEKEPGWSETHNCDVWTHRGDSIYVYYDENDLVCDVTFNELYIGEHYEKDNNDEKNEVKWKNWYENDSELYANALNADRIGQASRIPIYKMESLEELEQFKKKYVEESTEDLEDTYSFQSATKGMNEDYFKEYTVFVIYVLSNSSSWEYGVEHIDRTDFKLSIYVEQVNHPLTLEDEYEGQFVVVSLKKSEVEGIQSFDAYFRNRKWYFSGVISSITENNFLLHEVVDGVETDNLIRVRNLFYPEWDMQVGDQVTVVYDGWLVGAIYANNVYELFFIDEGGEVVSVFPED